MEQSRKNSTRLWLLVIGIAFAVLKEILEHNQIPISTETLITIEAAILATAGLYFICKTSIDWTRPCSCAVLQNGQRRYNELFHNNAFILGVQ